MSPLIKVNKNKNSGSKDSFESKEAAIFISFRLFL